LKLPPTRTAIRKSASHPFLSSCKAENRLTCQVQKTRLPGSFTSTAGAIAMIRISRATLIRRLVLYAVLATLRPTALLHSQSTAGAPIDAPTPQVDGAATPPAPEAPANASLPSAPAASSADSSAGSAARNIRGRQGHQIEGASQQHQLSAPGSFHFTLWDRTPFDAYLPGGSARGGQQITGPGAASDQNPSFQGIDDQGQGDACTTCSSGVVGTDSANIGMAPSGGRIGIGSGMGSVSTSERGAGRVQFGQPNLGLLMRSAVGMNMRSSLGSFRMSYSEAAKANSIDKGTAQAAFNSATFGKMFNFSAAEMIGPGASRGAFLSGAGNNGAFGGSGLFGSPLGAGVGAGSDKRPTTSVTMRMSF
jgi:hypothetical protein